MAAGHKPGRVPRLWLLSDPVRLPDPEPAAMRLPRGSAVLARGMAWTELRSLAALCRRRGLLLFVGGDGRAALRLRAGLHVPERGATGLLAFLRGGGALSVAVHGRAGSARGRRLQADTALISPIFPTVSHPGGRALGPHGWAWLARHAGRPAVALGGVNGTTARRVPRLAAGFAAIGGLNEGAGNTLFLAGRVREGWPSRRAFTT